MFVHAQGSFVILDYSLGHSTTELVVWLQNDLTEENAVIQEMVYKAIDRVNHFLDHGTFWGQGIP